VSVGSSLSVLHVLLLAELDAGRQPTETPFSLVAVAGHDLVIALLFRNLFVGSLDL
jgi:hypothetical protein